MTILVWRFFCLSCHSTWVLSGGADAADLRLASYCSFCQSQDVRRNSIFLGLAEL